jgi:hypothetical protein
MTVPQTHYGLCVTDIDDARAALASIGFTRVQPNAPEPLVYRDEPGDEVGQRTCPDLGSPYRTHYVEHPGTGQQIDLIEIAAHAIEARPTATPIEGDLTVTVPCDDPVAAQRTMQPFVGDRMRFVAAATDVPAATLHYSPAGWERSEPFLADVLGVEIVDGRCIGVGGEIDIAVSTATTPAPPGIGKRYVGANHLRLLHRDFDRIVATMSSVADVRWALPPDRGFGFIVGPSNETIELFAR